MTARTSSDPADVVRRILESWDEGRVDAALALIHPDIEWHEPPEMPDQTIAHGREAALKALQTWFATWASYENELREVQEAGQRVLVDFRQRMAGAGSNITVESDLFQVWTVRDGLAVRMEMYTDRAQAMTALGERVKLFGKAFRCTSRSSGLRCQNRSGHGWFLSKRTQSRF